MGDNRILFNVPVVVFAYNRPHCLLLLLESLREDEVPMIYFFCDGPKNDFDNEQLIAVREIIESVDWCGKFTYYHSTNIGLGNSIRFGVSEVLSKHKSAIIFEDDLICIKGTYRYLSSALNYYDEEEKIMSVTGWTHPKIVPNNINGKPYFDGKSDSWCWGTWTTAWAKMNNSALSIYNHCVLNGIDVEKYGTDMPKMALEAKQKNLWAIGWWYLHMLHDGLCLRPPYSLIETTSWDGSGTTVTPEMMEWMNPPLRTSCVDIFEEYPAPLENDMCPLLWKLAIDGTDFKTQNFMFTANVYCLENGIWYIDSLLSNTECDYLILEGRKQQFKLANNSDLYGRYNKEAFFKSIDFLNLIKSRLKECINKSESGLSFYHNMSEIFEIYFYETGDYILPHQDAPIPLTNDVKSTHTMIIYLNEGYDGGETNFPTLNKKIKLPSGSVLLFDQSLTHEGLSVLRNEKYILRFNVSLS